MFATFKPQTGRRGTAILKSAAPGGGILGPYTPWSRTAGGVSGPVTPAEWECLDGTFFAEDGLPYMVFCHEWQQVGDGQICAMRLTDDLRQAAGEPFLLFTASEAPWAFPLQGRAPGSYVTDGPFMYRAPGGSLCMLWSSFGETGNYCIGGARSQSGALAGPWTQSPEPLFSADGGHGMVFRGFDGKMRLAIHSPNKTPLERAVFVELAERDGGLFVQLP
jgi:hypothetical protein